MDKTLKTHITDQNTWIRGLTMLLFVVIYAVARLVIGAVVAFQFLSVLFTGTANGRLLKFGQSLGTYIYQIILYLTFNSADRPYPFGTWPSGPPPGRHKRTASADKEKADRAVATESGQTGSDKQSDNQTG